MTSSLEQSIKERLRFLAHERKTSFAELWTNLILERFLARLSRSSYKKHFIFKGGALLARYITLGRETKDLDFLIEKLSNSEQSLHNILNEICSIDLEDGFLFQNLRIKALVHTHMLYQGATISLLAKFGGTKTNVNIDLGFGDIVQTVEQSFPLTSTKKGPLFESHIQLHCYPKEFIFAEKLETVVFRGSANSRMKDFHDLYSLTQKPDCLNSVDTERAIKMVFRHRKASLLELPLTFENSVLDLFQIKWTHYHRELIVKQPLPPVPKEISAVMTTINDWLHKNTNICCHED